MNDMVLPDGYFSIHMQPEYDDYLSNFAQPQKLQLDTTATQDPPNLTFGKGLNIGFTILVLIWTYESINEWISIEDAKSQYYNSQSGSDLSYEYPSCDPDDSAYNIDECQDRIFEDAMESREIDLGLEIIKLFAWVTIWVSLARIMMFGNITTKVLNTQSSQK